jgi:hypothetical protein
MKRLNWVIKHREEHRVLCYYLASPHLPGSSEFSPCLKILHWIPKYMVSHSGLVTRFLIDIGEK